MSAGKGSGRVTQRRRRKFAFEQQVDPSVFQLSRDQIQELRETFNFLDEDKDGIISHADLRSVLVALGQVPSGKEITEMLGEVQGVVDFSRFVCLFASMMSGTGDSDELVRSAFTCFDEDDDGFLSLEDLRAMLTSMGSRLTDQQVDEVFLHGLGADMQGRFKSEDVVRLLKHGESSSALGSRSST